MSDINYFVWANTLTGGGDGALDSFDGDTLTNGDPSVTVDATAMRVFFHRLNATSGEDHNPPKVVEPATNPGDKRWELIGSVLMSTPEDTGYWIADIRLDADKKILVKYDDTPEA